MDLKALFRRRRYRNTELSDWVITKEGLIGIPTGYGRYIYPVTWFNMNGIPMMAFAESPELALDIIKDIRITIELE